MALTLALSNFNPTGGTGNGTVTVTISQNTGRDSRSATFKINGKTGATGTATSKTVTVNQSGATEVVTCQNAVTMAATATTVTITGTSNSSGLTFTLSNNNVKTLVVPATFTANSASQTLTSGSGNIVGDPGKSNKYDWSITLTGGTANSTVSSRTSVLTVKSKSDASKSGTCTITQSRGASTFNVSPTTIDIEATGTTGSTTVTSNDTWTVSLT